MSLATPDSIRKLQRKLYLKAKDEPAFRFHLLDDKICREDILHHAYDVAAQPTPRDNNHLMGKGFSGFLLNPLSEIKLENLEERQRRYSIQ